MAADPGGAAKAALLLISQDFLASDFIADNELPRLLKAAGDKGVHIFWVAVSASTVGDTELTDFQPVNDPEQPLDALSPPERQKQLVQIYKRIKEVIEA